MGALYIPLFPAKTLEPSTIYIHTFNLKITSMLSIIFRHYIQQEEYKNRANKYQ